MKMLVPPKYIAELPKPIAIIGMGISGDSVKELFEDLGLKHKVDYYTFDQKNFADFNDPSLLLETVGPKTLVVSPGVSLSTPWIKNFKGKLTSELSVAAACLTSEKVIGITGSVGKSTTTAALAHSLKYLDSNVFHGGNFGVPLAKYCTQLIKGQRQKADWLILELSSYQLENIENLIFDRSIIVSLTPNHLERYKSITEYYNTKLKIIDLTKYAVYLNKNGSELFDYLKSKTYSISKVWTSHEDIRNIHYNFNNARLVGLHNKDNLSLCLRLLEDLSAPKECFESLFLFSGLQHRLELVETVKNVRYINDSKATTIESVLTACSSLLPEAQDLKHIHLLLGGRDKNLPWEKLRVLKNEKSIVFYFFGECANLAQSKCLLPGSSFKTLSSLLSQDNFQTSPGDIVLLSPGGSSLDEFKNFEERGEFFKNFVYKMSSESHY